MTSLAERVLLALTDVDTLERRFRAGDHDEALLLALLRHGSDETAADIASCISASEAVLIAALGHRHRDVRLAVAVRHDIDANLLPILVTDDDATIRETVAVHPSLHPSLGEMLARDRFECVRAAAATGNLTLAAIELLSNDSRPGVRAALAGRPGLPRRIQRRLVDDTFVEVRRALAEHCTEPDLIIQLIEDITEIAVVAARSPHADADGLRIAARFEDPDVRRAVAEHPNLPADVVDLLAEDTWQIRQVLAGNVNVEPGVLERLSTDASTRVRTAALTNPSIGDDALLAALASPHLANRRCARATLTARGVALPTIDGVPRPDDELAAVFAWVETTDRFDDLAALVVDRTWPVGVRRTALLRVPLPDVVFEAAATAEPASIRRDAADHRQCPRSVLERLATDRSTAVRERAAARLAD